MNEFMSAVKQNYGEKVLIQFEDFANHNAFDLLAKYSPTHLVFNDDIQGTASVVLAGLISALKLVGESLADHRFLFLGAGEAGTGIAELIALEISKQTRAPLEEARKKIWLVDSKGRIVKSQLNSLQHWLKPIILALSNPTSKSECTTEQAYTWSEGCAIFASGSQFGPVEYNWKVYVSGQSNNAYIFPGLGLGLIISGAIRVHDDMLLAASEALAAQITLEHIEKGLIYPPFTNIRKYLASRFPQPENLIAYAASCMYSPNYQKYR
ncbi:putative malate dehydrogenase (oxaloacetate-decarboxylating) (NADP(+)) [Helianthus annuus]|uniref:Malic enzyme n=1 Tax=Helianthus annuus TaxID=4232 RepID=A0A9K3J4N7_HELAN|nr:putative malate dehydrogenase (oxaloacetate-decarboxylating) (NADP(+)) [Helianthus annuus]